VNKRQYNVFKLQIKTKIKIKIKIIKYKTITKQNKPKKQKSKDTFNGNDSSSNSSAPISVIGAESLIGWVTDIGATYCVVLHIKSYVHICRCEH
jgi:hypothetical protein